jgi:DNA-directed RNA polymerase subunit RPC12/RpoP
MPFDDDVREPEASTTCFECRRVVVGFDVDRCPHCGSRLMLTEATIANILARRGGRPIPKTPKARRA